MSAFFAPPAVPAATSDPEPNRRKRREARRGVEAGRNRREGVCRSRAGGARGGYRQLPDRLRRSGAARPMAAAGRACRPRRRLHARDARKRRRRGAARTALRRHLALHPDRMRRLRGADRAGRYRARVRSRAICSIFAPAAFLAGAQPKRSPCSRTEAAAISTSSSRARSGICPTPPRPRSRPRILKTVRPTRSFDARLCHSE